MNETQKPFVCAKQGCEMAFTNEDHLNVHKKKHDMALHLGIDTQNNTVADQTPTPTRFIRNCEEVGLFQDLQNVNPFDETFRKATELVKSGSLHVPESSSDDTLHTPHIFPYIEEKNQVSKFSRNNSNEPEFTVTTINAEFLRLGGKKGLLLTEESDDSGDIGRNDLLKQNDLVNGSSNDGNTLISKDSLISNLTPTAIPVPSLYENSEIPTVVINDLSDFQINSSKNAVKEKICINSLEKKNSSDKTVKSKLIETLNNRVKTEESESDDCDNSMVIQEIEKPSSFNSNVRLKTIKSSPKKVITKHSNTRSLRDNTIFITTSGSTTTKGVSVITNTQNKKSVNVKQTKSPATQSQLERQRELNRAAQVRSRQKKKYCQNQMEIEMALLQRDKNELIFQNQTLRDEVILLKTMLTYHKDCPVSQDPEIMEEINASVKIIQEEQQKRLQKERQAKKVVSICPNPTSVIALTPVPSPVFIQVPTQVAQSIAAMPTTTSLRTQASQPITLASTNSKNATIQIGGLSTFTTKPLAQQVLTANAAASSARNGSNENPSLNIISKLSENLNSSNLKCTSTKVPSKAFKAKNKLQHKKKKVVTNKNVNNSTNVIKLSSNNFFIVAQGSK